MASTQSTKNNSKNRDRDRDEDRRRDRERDRDRREEDRNEARASQADSNEVEDEDFDIDEDDYSDEQVGLPPYWNPEVGRKFKAVVVGIDEKDPEFPRYQLRASAAVRCGRGPSDDAETVLVKKGQYFTCSTYAALPLNRYIGYEVIVICVKLREGVTKQGYDVWEFRVLTDSETKKQLQDRRAIQRADERL